MKIYKILLFSLLSLGIIVISSINPISALTESECLSLTNLGSIEQSYTVVTCDNPFNVSVNMGQRLHIQNPNGGSNNMLPSASYGSVGTYAYSSDGTTGTVKLQNPPNVEISFQNIQVSFSGSQMSVSGNIINSNNFPVKNLYVYWHVTDSFGNYLTSWHRSGNDGQAYSAQIPAQSSGTFSETVCCLPSSGASQATPYLIQAFREDGTKLIPVSVTSPKPTIAVNSPSSNINTTIEGNNPDLKIMVTGNVQNKISGNNFIHVIFKDPSGIAVYDTSLALDSQGNFNNEFDNPLFVKNMRDSGVYSAKFTYNTIVSEFNWNYKSSVYTTTPSGTTVLMGQGTASNTNCGDQCFVPNTVNVAVGGKITWMNVDSAAHTATASDGSFDTSLVNAGGLASQTFNTVGTYPYICILHPWMKGTVVVGSGNTSPNTLAIKTDKTSYYSGDLVTISGTGFSSSKTINIRITSSSGSLVEELTMTSTKTGTFQTLWPIPQQITSNSYKITAIESTKSVSTMISVTGEQESSDEASISVETDLPLYDQGDTVVVSGYITNYDANNPTLVTLRTVNEDGNNILSVKQTKPQYSGFFEDSIVLSGPLWQKEGDYKIIANYATAKSETFFYYTGSTSEIPTDTMYVKTDRTYYEEGDVVQIYGKIETFLPNTPLLIQVFRESNRVHIAQVEVTQDGSFTYTLSTVSPYFQKDGEYLVQVSYGVTGDVFETSFAFAMSDDLPSAASVTIPAGSSTPGCESTNQCYIQAEVEIASGGEVVWFNADSASHTVTSGNPKSGPNGVFDSGLFLSGQKFSHKFEERGEFPYFCLVHPWMQGTVFVGYGNPDPEPDPTPSPTPDIEFYTTTDKTDYDLGELVTLSVNISDISSPQNVAITVTDPFGTIVVSRTITTDSTGSASTDFKIAESFKTGTYRIDATSLIDGWTYLDDSTFKITSQFNQIQIVSAQGTDQQGNPTQFTRGSMGFVKVQVNAEKNIATLITVNVFDSDLTPIGMGSLKTTLSPGQSELILSFLIPDDAVVGTADIYVNALSDWVSAGGIPQTGEFAGQVRIN